MMDSQENTLELGKNEEVVNEEVTSQVETTENSEPAAEQSRSRLVWFMRPKPMYCTVCRTLHMARKFHRRTK